MLPFFRKIRWRLAADNQFFKYSRYAVGEIVLVVVGILIALQINNWNENRKNSNLERKLLTELISDLETNIESLNASNMSNVKSIAGIDSLIYHFNNSTSSDSLRSFLSGSVYISTLNLSYSSFESMKTIGFEIINDDQIRLSIIDLFEISYTHHVRSINEVEQTYFQTYMDWYMNNRHKINLILESPTIRNGGTYNFMRNYVESKRIWKTDMIEGNNRLIVETKALKELIVTYLTRP